MRATSFRPSRPSSVRKRKRRRLANRNREHKYQLNIGSRAMALNKPLMVLGVLPARSNQRFSEEPGNAKYRSLGVETEIMLPEIGVRDMLDAIFEVHR